MSKINKYNEFINNEESIIKQLIIEGENTPSSDLEHISQRKSYREVVSLGKKVIPYLLQRMNENNSPIWDKALSKLTGCNHDGYKPDEIGFYHLNVDELVKFWKKWGIENGYL